MGDRFIIDDETKNSVKAPETSVSVSIYGLWGCWHLSREICAGKCGPENRLGKMWVRLWEFF